MNDTTSHSVMADILPPKLAGVVTRIQREFEAKHGGCLSFDEICGCLLCDHFAERNARMLLTGTPGVEPKPFYLNENGVAEPPSERLFDFLCNDYAKQLRDASC